MFSQGWMEGMESRLGKYRALAVHTDKLLAQMDDLADLTEEIANQQSEVDGTVDEVSSSESYAIIRTCPNSIWRYLPSSQYILSEAYAVILFPGLGADEAHHERRSDTPQGQT
jgi:hypothetical protein